MCLPEANLQLPDWTECELSGYGKHEACKWKEVSAPSCLSAGQRGMQLLRGKSHQNVLALAQALTLCNLQTENPSSAFPTSRGHCAGQERGE